MRKSEMKKEGGGKEERMDTQKEGMGTPEGASAEEAAIQRHIDFIHSCFQTKNRLFYISEPIRTSTMFWMVNSLFLMRKHSLVGEMEADIEQFLEHCQNPDGGFGGNIGAPSSVLASLPALQLLYLAKRNKEILPEAAREKLAAKREPPPGPKDARLFTAHDRMQELLGEGVPKKKGVFLDMAPPASAPGQEKKKDEAGINYALCNQYLDSLVSFERGAIVNDKFEEHDQRFLCCYVACKTLLALLNPSLRKTFTINDLTKELIYEYISRSMNEDGGVGSSPNAESHAAYTFCAVSTLFLLGKLDMLDTSKTSRFLALRQNPSGGLSGRPDKGEDVCYSFWSYSALVMMGKKDYVDENKLKAFINSCQDESGGFSDRPGNVPDLFHTMFALVALGLIGSELLVLVNPAICV